LSSIQNNEMHTSLGKNLSGNPDWRTQGLSTFNFTKLVLGIEPSHRVVDYGCGTLRLGYHYMNYLERGNYFGLDKMPEFLAIGRELAGPLIDKSRATVTLCDEAGIQAAKAANPNFIISVSVARHVPDDGLGLYTGNLVALARAAGAKVLFNANLSDSPFRFGNSGWSRPLSTYEEAMGPMELVEVHKKRPHKDYGEHAWLEFRWR
jgi:SAM-dependent methyltransferase